MKPHTWAILVTFAVEDPVTFALDGHVLELGQEQVLTYSGPGCLTCGITYTPDVDPECHGGVDIHG